MKHFNDKHLLNKKSEFISKCRHENKLLVKSVEKGFSYIYIYVCMYVCMYMYMYIYKRIETF